MQTDWPARACSLVYGIHLKKMLHSQYREGKYCTLCLTTYDIIRHTFLTIPSHYRWWNRVGLYAKVGKMLISEEMHVYLPMKMCLNCWFYVFYTTEMIKDVAIFINFIESIFVSRELFGLYFFSKKYPWWRVRHPRFLMCIRNLPTQSTKFKHLNNQYLYYYQYQRSNFLGNLSNNYWNV